VKLLGIAFSCLTTLVLATAVAAAQGGVSLENNINRGGSDYRNYQTGADPGQCRTDCANDPTCRAFTWVRPGLQGAGGHCWLKSAVPNASPDACCVSGVKAGAASTTAAAGGLEVDVNRQGGDYRHFELRSYNPNECRDACFGDPRCRSFTYLRPSYWGPSAHCFLKESTPAATQNPCCISGVHAGGDDPLDSVRDIDNI
jgi:hypothetical protein